MAPLCENRGFKAFGAFVHFMASHYLLQSLPIVQYRNFLTIMFTNSIFLPGIANQLPINNLLSLKNIR